MKVVSKSIIPTMTSCNACGQHALHRCGHCLKVSYCGKNCQKQDWKTHSEFCGLKVQEKNVNGKRIEVDYPKLVGLVSKTDGSQFQLSEEDAKQMQTIALAIESAQDGNDDYIPLDLDEATLRLVVGLATSHDENVIPNDLSSDQLLMLLNAADYLQFDELLRVTYIRMADAVEEQRIPMFEIVNRLKQIDHLDFVLFGKNRRNGKSMYSLINKIDDELKRRILKNYLKYTYPTSSWGFMKASRYGRLRTVQLLLNTPNRGIKPAMEDNRAIQSAAGYGHVEVVQLLLNTPNRGIDPAVDNNRAIQSAAGNGHVEVVQLLLNTPNRGIDPAAFNNRAIKMAARNGQVKVVEMLLDAPDRGIDITDDLRYTLNVAASSGYDKVVELILKRVPRTPQLEDVVNSILEWNHHLKPKVSKLFTDYLNQS